MARLLDRDGIVFLVVDMQDTLLKKCQDWEKVTQRTIVFSQFCHILSVPIVMTEQHPKGLGRTNLQLREATGVEPIPKTTFSCFKDPGFVKALEAMSPRTLVMAGIEAHICITQTALEAVERGMRVHVLEDAVTARAEWMRANAFGRLRQEGVTLSNTESAMYEMMGDSADPLFKRMLFLVK
jgi:nicotinamidase-related amidase